MANPQLEIAVGTLARETVQKMKAFYSECDQDFKESERRMFLIGMFSYYLCEGLPKEDIEAFKFVMREMLKKLDRDYEASQS